MERTTRIALVEDEESDVFIFKKAFEKGKLDHDIAVFPNGDELLAHLDACEANGEPPDLVLLDLNLPGRSGIEVLEHIRGGSSCSTVVAHILTTSSHPGEVKRAYAAGANAYVTKPYRMADLERYVESVESFWFGLAQRPT